MGMAQGLLNAYKANEQRDKEEEAQAKLDALNSENMRLKKVDMLAKYAAKHFTGSGYQVASKSGGKMPVKSSQHYINILEQFGIQEDLIAQSAGYGPRNLRMIADKLQKTQVKYQETYGKNSKLPVDLYNDALESLIVTQRNSPTFDITKYEELFDVKLTDVERLMITPQTNQYPDVAFAPDTLYVKGKVTQSELIEIEKRGVDFAVGAARTEQNRLAKRLNKIVSIAEEGVLSEQVEAEKKWIESRLRIVSGALEDNRDKDPSSVINLYGNQFIQEVIASDERFEDALFNPVFKEARQTRIEVPNKNVAIALAKSGILKIGMEVLNLSTGRVFRITGGK
jgi:hypothetical protein